MKEKRRSIPGVFTPGVLFLVGFLFVSLVLVYVVVFSASEINTVYACIWVLAPLAFGGFWGFLFGLPNKGTQTDLDRVVDTNIFEISNWLTKIIIGAGLVQLREVSSFTYRISGRIARSISDYGDVGSIQIFVVGLLIYCFTLGLVGGYAITQIFLLTELAKYRHRQKSDS